MSFFKTSLQYFFQQNARRKYDKKLKACQSAYTSRLQADAAAAGNELQAPAFCCSEKNAKELTISIIICSKDNASMLEKCLKSIRATSTAGDKTEPEGLLVSSLEIIVTDNGSNSENRLKVNEILNKTFAADSVFTTHYLYEKEDFNFSRMCNKGAAAARGDLLLFLNDDVEALTPGWLQAMAAVALAEGNGAVGAKLLYPEGSHVSSDMHARFIQHCGVVNTRVGPIHVFGRLSDDVSYVNGYNQKCVPAIAVTGACLMIRKSVFDEIGGFSEELAVAFNDVDLCYTLVERGYTNLSRNDVTLLHYESFSRGDDSIHAEKRLRLMREYRMLMSRHRMLIGVDPFFPKTASTQEENPFPGRAVTDAFNPDTLPPSRLCPFVMPKGVREDKALFSVTEYSDKLWLWKCGDVYKRGTGRQADDESLLIWGYTFVIGSDNALYKRTLLLKKIKPDGAEYKEVDDEILACSVHEAYRPDIAARIPDQLHALMCGFYAKIEAKYLSAGLYKIGILAEKTFSSEKLLSWRMSILLRD